MIDWSKKIPAPENRVPDLSALRFEYLLASQTAQGEFFEDILNDVLGDIKNGNASAGLPADPGLYRLAKSRLAGGTFVFADVLALIMSAQPYLAARYPNETLDEQTVKTIWMEAAS